MFRVVDVVLTDCALLSLDLNLDQGPIFTSSREGKKLTTTLCFILDSSADHAILLLRLPNKKSTKIVK
jgi:hypothetical protein